MKRCRGRPHIPFLRCVPRDGVTAAWGWIIAVTDRETEAGREKSRFLLRFHEKYSILYKYRETRNGRA